MTNGSYGSAELSIVLPELPLVGPVFSYRKNLMNKLRFRSGQVHLRRVPVDAATVIEAGDLVWLDGDDAKPASQLAWGGTLAATQASFAAKFLGIAHQPSLAGDTTPISIDVSGDSVYEVDVASAIYKFGDTLGPDENSSKLTNQSLEAAATANAIARSCEFSTAATSTLRVSFASAYGTSSANVNAAIG